MQHFYWGWVPFELTLIEGKRGNQDSADSYKADPTTFLANPQKIPELNGPHYPQVAGLLYSSLDQLLDVGHLGRT